VDERSRKAGRWRRRKRRRREVGAEVEEVELHR